MDSPASLVLTAVVVGLAVWLWRQSRPRGFPPGLPCLPVVGSILSMTSQPLHIQIEAWRKKYGDILAFSTGSHHVVALSGYNVLRDAMVKHTVEFAGKLGADDTKMACYTPNFPILGIFTGTYSDEWRHQRHASMQILRQLGYSKSSLENQVQAEACALRDSLAATQGRPTNPAYLLGITVANVICLLFWGERYDHDSLESQKLVHIVDVSTKYIIAEDIGHHIWLLSLRPAYKQAYQTWENVCNDLNKFNEGKIKERRDRLEEDGYSEPRDFIEHYLCQLNKARSTKMAEYWLPGIINDFFLAGTESVSTTMSWAFLWMAARPDVQDKVYAELSHAMEANNGEITMSLKGQCPYVEATILEILRIRPLSPLAPRAVTTDVNFQGYNIPKGTQVFMNLYSVLMDPEAWPEPDQFKPERHLDEGRAIQTERWIPFSMGRRSCIGEQLAKQELFLFFATTVASFRIRLPEGRKANVAPPATGLSMLPNPYEVIFEPRV